jgi:tetratricopeptide (TPR) repeat protein
MPARDLYAESFAPLLDFGWSQLRSIRSQGSKYIEAPKAELYDTVKDPGELVNTYEANAPRASAMQAAVRRYSGAALTAGDMNDPEARRRLQALGYASGSRSPADASRPDPKDRRELAALVANVASGELEGAVLETTLRRILAEDPLNPQANLRLGYVLLGRNRCREASPHFRSAIVAHLPSADAHLGLAACQTAEHSLNAAASTLQDAERVEPGNPVVMANLGLVLSDSGHPNQAIDPLQRALAIDPDLHQARFALAIAFARAGRRGEAGAAAEDLLRRLPREAPQRAEVERLLREVK